MNFIADAIQLGQGILIIRLRRTDSLRQSRHILPGGKSASVCPKAHVTSRKTLKIQTKTITSPRKHSPKGQDTHGLTHILTIQVTDLVK